MKRNLCLSFLAMILLSLNANTQVQQPNAKVTANYAKSVAIVSDTSYWKSDGYGYLAEKIDDRITLYDITAISLVKAVDYEMIDNILYFQDDPIGEISLSGDTMVVNVGQLYTFRKLDNALSLLSGLQIKGESSDPLENFDVFWQTFEEHCVLFDIAGVNWNEIKQTYRPLVSENTTDEELFGIFSQMLETLKDGHSGIQIPGTTYSYSPGPQYEPFWILETGTMITNLFSYIDEDDVNAAAHGFIFSGKIDGDIGYLNIISMEELGDGSVEGDVEVIKQVMDSLIIAWSNCRSVIIDVRLNGGGYDAVSNTIAGYFYNNEQLGYTKYVRNGGYNDFLEPIAVFIKPAETTFGDIPVFVLTSNLTASASDVFAMDMNNLPNVTLVGEHTYGIFSDKLDKFLPNGWMFSLSNEKYLSTENVNYEQSGIQPDIPLPMERAAFDAGRDNVLEYAIDAADIQTTFVKEPFNDGMRIECYPNPFTSKVIIDLIDNADDISRVDIHSLSGVKVAEWLNLHGKYFECTTESMPAGIYLLSITAGKKTKTIKVSKK